MCKFANKNYSESICVTSKMPVRDITVSQLTKEKSLLIEGDATGLAIHSLL